MQQLSRRALLALLGSTALVGPAAAETVSKSAAPIDQAPRDPALAKVRADMLAAVKAKDFKRLQPHLDPRIELNFGGGKGAAEFGRRLAKDRVLWEELQWVLENGGRLDGGAFWAPYTFSADTGKLDPFEAGVTVADAVPARAEPRAAAPLVATLGRQSVKVVDWGDAVKVRPFYKRRDWVKIELAGGRTAYIEARLVRSTVDYRAGFKKIRGVWKMNVFIAGD
jgi:hypothetical protein